MINSCISSSSLSSPLSHIGGVSYFYYFSPPLPIHILIYSHIYSYHNLYPLLLCPTSSPISFYLYFTYLLDYIAIVFQHVKTIPIYFLSFSWLYSLYLNFLLYIRFLFYPTLPHHTSIQVFFISATFIFNSFFIVCFLF